MRCQEIRELLSSYIDEQLDTARQQEISSHLSKCEDCRIELEELQDAAGFLQQVPAVVPPSEFRHRLREQVYSEGGSSACVKPTLFQRLAKKQWALAAAAAVIVLAIGVSMIWEQFSGQPARTDMAQEKNNGPTVRDTGESANQDSDSTIYGTGEDLDQKSNPAVNDTGEDSSLESDSSISEESIDEPERNGGTVQEQPAPTGEDSIGESPPEDNLEKMDTEERHDTPESPADNEFSMMSEPSSEIHEEEESSFNKATIRLAVDEDSLEEVKREIIDKTKQYESEIENINEAEMKIIFSEEYYEEVLRNISSSGEVVFAEENQREEESSNNISVTVQFVPREEE